MRMNVWDQTKRRNIKMEKHDYEFEINQRVSFNTYIDAKLFEWSTYGLLSQQESERVRSYEDKQLEINLSSLRKKIEDI